MGGATMGAASAGAAAFAGSGVSFFVLVAPRFFFFAADFFAPGPARKYHARPPRQAARPKAIKSQAHHGKLLLPLPLLAVVVVPGTGVVRSLSSSSGDAPAQSGMSELHGTGQL